MLYPRKAVLVFGLTITLLQAAPAAVAAETPGLTTITADVENDILWFETVVDAHLGGTLRTKILTPRDGEGDRTLWQTCSFQQSSPGTYRCGIDVSVGSLARAEEGTWVGRAVLDSDRLARRFFWM